MRGNEEFPSISCFKICIIMQKHEVYMRFASGMFFCSSIRSARVVLSTTLSMASFNCCQIVNVVQRPACSQWLMSSSRQETGARLPSAARRIMPTVYSSGFLVFLILRNLLDQLIALCHVDAVIADDLASAL